MSFNWPEELQRDPDPPPRDWSRVVWVLVLVAVVVAFWVG